MFRLVSVLAVLLIVVSAAPAAAQANEPWKVTFAPYFMGAGLSGTTAVAGQEVTIDASFSDILSKLQFGAAGLVVARKGNWGTGFDFMWTALGGNATSVDASVDVSDGLFAFYGLRRLSPAADLTFGGRINYLSTNLRINAPLQTRSVSGTKTWFDPIVGLTLHTPENGKRWHAQVYTEIGGFGLGSTFAWQIFPTVGVDLSKKASLEFGWRWIKDNYSSGENLTYFKYDVLMQGPVVGFGFRF